MTSSGMGFQDIYRSLQRGERIHQSLKSEMTEKSAIGRLFIWLRELLGRQTEYSICSVADGILKKIETPSHIGKLSPSEKTAALNVISHLEHALEKVGRRDTRAQSLSERMQKASLIIRASYSNPSAASHSLAPQQINPLHIKAGALALPPHLRSRYASLPAPAPVIIDRKFEPAELFVHLRKIFNPRGQSELATLELAQNLCLILNSKREALASSNGQCIRLDKNAPISVGQGKRVALPFSAWLKLNTDGTGIRLQIIPHEKKIGSGSYKKVKKSFSIFLPIDKCPDGTRNIHMKETVLLRVQDEDGAVDAVKKGIAHQKEIVDLAESGAHLVPPPELYTIRSGKKRPLLKLETHQEWYNGDFKEAIKTGLVPLDIDGKTKAPLSFIDRLTIGLDLSRALETMHRAGIVHRDVKPANVLLKSEEGLLRGYLSDFDLATRPGMTSLASKYHYWDSSSQRGYACFATDVMGCAMTLAESFIPNFFELFNGNRARLSQDAPAEHYHLAKLHLSKWFEQNGFSERDRANITRAFELHKGYSPEFNAFLTSYAKKRFTAAAQSLALKKLSVETMYFNAILSFACGLVAKDGQIRQALGKLTADEIQLMKTDGAYRESRFEAIVKAAQFPSIEAVSVFLSSLREGLLKDYASIGLP